ncbi:hypothetical protein ACWGI0_00225 [Streptomyces sp. NPDC054802]
MSPWKKRPRADHNETAARAKATPGEWVLAATYGSGYSADSIVRYVQTGAGKRGPNAYLPAGRFEAKKETVDDGTELWVRYLPATATTTGGAS